MSKVIRIDREVAGALAGYPGRTWGARARAAIESYRQQQTDESKEDVMKFTDKQQRAVLAAVAGWDPVGTSIELIDVDRQNLREQVTLELAVVLGIEGERGLNRMDALRMAGETAQSVVEASS